LVWRVDGGKNDTIDWNNRSQKPKAVAEAYELAIGTGHKEESDHKNGRLRATQPARKVGQIVEESSPPETFEKKTT